MQTILIFAGAGASKAVSPRQYPTTIEFFEALPASIKEHPLFNNVEAYLRESLGDQRLDIELVLWRLQEYRAFCQAALDNRQFPGWMIQTGRFNQTAQHSNANIGSFSDTARNTVRQLDQLISQINKKVYDLYAELPNKDDLERTWAPLLEGCLALGVKTEIVTTNYDMIIESALDGSSAADTGWRGSVYRVLKTDLWTAASESAELGLLTKLHGSVNWSRKEQTIYVSDPTFKGQHENHAIIYPGFKGVPDDPAFLAFHEHFRRALRASKVAIFVGFAFRDPYINDICTASLSPGTACIVINPQKVPLPFEVAEGGYIESSFDTDSVHTALSLARKALSAA